MKKIFKNASLVALGLVMGLSISSVANQPTIQATRDNITSIYVKGNQLNISKEDTPINYKNRLYVPLRLISENMGLVVDYDKGSKTVYITEKPLTKEEKLAKDTNLYEEPKADSKKTESKDIEEARKEDIPKKSDVDYKSLPISFKKDKFTIRLTLIVKKNSDYNSEYYFDAKNEDTNGIVIDPISAKLDYTDERGNERQLDARDVNIGAFDKKVLSSLDQNFDGRIYLTLPQIPDGLKQGTLSFNMYPVGDNTNITKVIMPIKID